jgi:AmiR/NasT family two-component response regulator
MEREGVTEDGAFDMLRALSQNQNVKLREIAQQLVDSTRQRSSRSGDRAEPSG